MLRRVNIFYLKAPYKILIDESAWGPYVFTSVRFRVSTVTSMII